MEEKEKTGTDLVQTFAYYLDVDLEQADQSIKACLLDAGRNVIAVGYYLKVIRGRELFRDAGYRTYGSMPGENTDSANRQRPGTWPGMTDSRSAGTAQSWQRSTGSTAEPSSRRCCPWTQSRWSR